MPTYTCAITGKQFELRDKDLAFYEKMGVPIPTICPEEMTRQVMSCRNEWNLYRRKCDKTGEEMLAVYDADVPFPVYKNEIWWSDSWDATEYGQEIDWSLNFWRQFKQLQNKVPREGVSNVNCENCDYNLHTRDSRNCYLCSLMKDAENAYYCNWFIGRDCVDCRMIVGGELCYECLNVWNSYECVMSQELTNCHNCYFCYQCRGCKDCIGCSNLANKQYYIFNKKVSKEEYEATKAKILNGSYQTWLQGQEYFKKMWNDAYHKATHTINCENTIGDVLKGCKNVHHGFEGWDLEDGAYTVSFASGSKDIYHSYSTGWDACELVHNSVVIRSSTDIRWSYYIWNCQDMTYCDSCSACKHCFGCVGLKRKEHCIFNKQYSPEEYERVKEKLIDHMKQTEEWGIFGNQMTTYAYNESSSDYYLPIDKDAALELGYRWKEDIEKGEMRIEKRIELPDSVDDVDESICAQVLTCEKTGKPYRIIQPELKFYKNMRLPLPRLSPEARRKAREARRNPYKLWKGKSALSGAEVWTSFEPGRPEKIVTDEEFLDLVD